MPSDANGRKKTTEFRFPDRIDMSTHVSEEKGKSLP